MRGVPRWLAVLAVLAVVAVVCAFTARHALSPAELVAQLSTSTLPADGFSSAELKISPSDGRELRGLQVQLQSPHQLSIESLRVASDSATATLQAGILPGEARLRITAPGLTSREIALRTTLDMSDSVGDGTPDFLRLHDRCRPACLPSLVHAAGRIAILPRQAGYA